jgi:hypothetical protein
MGALCGTTSSECVKCVKADGNGNPLNEPCDQAAISYSPKPCAEYPRCCPVVIDPLMVAARTRYWLGPARPHLLVAANAGDFWTPILAKWRGGSSQQATGPDLETNFPDPDCEDDPLILDIGNHRAVLTALEHRENVLRYNMMLGQIELFDCAGQLVSRHSPDAALKALLDHRART